MFEFEVFIGEFFTIDATQKKQHIPHIDESSLESFLYLLPPVPLLFEKERRKKHYRLEKIFDDQLTVW